MNLNKKRNIMTIFLITIFIIAVAFIIYFIVDTKKLETTEHVIYSERLPDQFDGFRITFLSDLHQAEFSENQENLIKQVEATDPDIIVVGGDVVSALPETFDKTTFFFNAMANIAPLYYTPGNHESHDGSFYKMLSYLNDIDMKVLFNQTDTLTIGSQSIDIIGLRDPGFAPDIKINKTAVIAERELKSLVPVAPENFSVLISHRPDYYEIYEQSKLDVVLTGHAHGGQLRVPFIGALVAPGQGLFPKYTDGVHYFNDTAMVISRGLGVSDLLPIRTFNRPEVVLVVLRKE